jgi:hypothetical protein
MVSPQGSSQTQESYFGVASQKIKTGIYSAQKKGHDEGGFCVE